MKELKPGDYKLTEWTGLSPDDITIGKIYKLYTGVYGWTYFDDDDDYERTASLGIWEEVKPAKPGDGSSYMVTGEKVEEFLEETSGEFLDLKPIKLRGFKEEVNLDEEMIDICGNRYTLKEVTKEETNMGMAMTKEETDYGPNIKVNKETPRYTAPDILATATNCIDNRAAERDLDEERSMLSTTKAFNAMYDTHLTEEMGWMFMVLLKMSRSRYGKCNIDHYVDGSAYFALAAEPSQRDR